MEKCDLRSLEQYAQGAGVVQNFYNCINGSGPAVPGEFNIS
ncbi:hypothetical protein [Paenibacillus sp. sgz500958]